MVMKLFKKKDGTAPDIPARVQRLSDTELLNWLDQNIMHFGATFDAWRRDAVPMDFVDESLDSLTVLWLEYKNRNQ
jgi:hypothetical protein